MIAPRVVPNPITETAELYMAGDKRVADTTRRRELDHCPDCGRGIFATTIRGVEVTACGQLEAIVPRGRDIIDLPVVDGDLVACGEPRGT